MFEILVVFLSSLPGVDPLKASQVFGLVPLHLLRRGCLALTQLLRPGTGTRADGPTYVSAGCVFDLGDERVAHAICCQIEPYLAFLLLFCCSLSFTLRLSSLVILRRSHAPKLISTRVSYSNASFTSQSSGESVVKLGEWFT